MGATVAAAVIIRKERELVEHFAEAGAVSPASARSSSDLGVHERFAWIRLVDRGVIREAAPGRYYFDEPTWVALRHEAPPFGARADDLCRRARWRAIDCDAVGRALVAQTHPPPPREGQMQRRDFLTTSLFGTAGLLASRLPFAASLDAASRRAAGRKILIAGGGYGTPFIRYMAALTGKPRPSCSISRRPRRTGQSGNYRLVPGVLAAQGRADTCRRASSRATRRSESWDEVLLSMDGIVCSGGNTLNQQAIWKAQGIDVVLRQAWDRGIVLGGSSAGSLCWFEEGTTDSRPKALSVVKCLGFLKGSHSPHYDGEPGRRPLYHQLIGSGGMKPGYACDNDAGIYFEDNEVMRVVATRAEAKVYYVSVIDGQVVERVMEPEHIE